MNSLHQLTAEQRATIYDWLTDLSAKEVVQKVAQPAPEGFGIHTHTTSLRRFKNRYWAELAADRETSARRLSDAASDSIEKLETGIQHAIRHHMFERVSTPDCTDEQLALVSRWSHRQEKLKLEIQRVQIARERCAQNQLRLQLAERHTVVREKTLQLRDRRANASSRNDALLEDLSPLDDQLSTDEDHLPNSSAPHHSDHPPGNGIPSDKELDEWLRFFPSPLPREVIKQNALYSRKIDNGEIKLITTPDNFVGVQYCNPADQPYFARDQHATFVPDPTRTTFLAPLEPYKPTQPNSRPSADAIPSTDAPNHSNGGTRSPSPILTSRDAAKETDTAPTDQNAPTSTLSQQAKRAQGNEAHPITEDDLSTLNAQHSTGPAAAAPANQTAPFKSQISNFQSTPPNPNPQPSADAIPSAAAPTPNTGGTRSPSPILTSRDAAKETDAAPADQNAPTSTLSQQAKHAPGNEAHPITEDDLSTLNAQLSTVPASAAPADQTAPFKSQISNFQSTPPNPNPQPSANANQTSDTHISNLETGNSKLPPPAPTTQHSELSTQHLPSPSAPSVPPSSVSVSLPSPAKLAATVDRYTIARMREYIAHDQKYTPWPYRHSPSEYITALRHCPCGHQCPCPIHESEEFGPFPDLFWKVRPLHPTYGAILRERNLPFRFPQEFVA